MNVCTALVMQQCAYKAPESFRVAWHQHSKHFPSRSLLLQGLPEYDLPSGSEGSNGLWTPDAHVALDWKGDPMRINPGDSLPGL